MKPSVRYAEFIKQSGFNQDPSQQQALQWYDRLYQSLIERHHHKPALLQTLFRRQAKKPTIKGLYFWGGVGTGKTFLMDIFFESLPFKQKKRFHFHHFMQQIHEKLKSRQNQTDPIISVAREFAENNEVLCLDEFVVTDIGDAMLIGGLLKSLIEQGVVLVTTSNSPPEDLYKDGLQRARFLPAIDLLQQCCDISQLDDGTDYRTRALTQTSLYQYPHDSEAEANINDFLEHHFIGAHRNGSIEINGRQIGYLFQAESAIWFNFDQVCQTARSRFDYLEIAQDFETLVLTGIPLMGDQSNDIARRFISLIDVLYDHRVKLLCTAADGIENLYQGRSLAFEFRRTISRLTEMQSEAYVSRAHVIN